jgi:hypothetical protein
MAFIPGGKTRTPYLILTACLALAVFGAFTFTAMNLFYSADFGGDAPDSGGFFASMYRHNLDCLAETSTAISRAGGHSFFPLRNGMPRIAMPQGTQRAGSAVLFSGLKIIEQTTYLPAKNNILLKLRI